MIRLLELEVRRNIQSQTTEVLISLPECLIQAAPDENAFRGLVRQACQQLGDELMNAWRKIRSEQR